MTHFTQGPWSLNDHEQVVDDDGRIICHMNDQFCNSGIEDQAEHFANASLIAMAPETYRSLKELCLMLKIVRKQLPENKTLEEVIKSSKKVLEQVNKQIELAS